jgi:hypothetical protein
LPGVDHWYTGDNSDARIVARVVGESSPRPASETIEYRILTPGVVTFPGGERTLLTASGSAVGTPNLQLIGTGNAVISARLVRDDVDYLPWISAELRIQVAAGLASDDRTAATIELDTESVWRLYAGDEVLNLKGRVLDNAGRPVTGQRVLVASLPRAVDGGAMLQPADLAEFQPTALVTPWTGPLSGPGGPASRCFATVNQLPDGRLMLLGGFANVNTPADSGAWIFDFDDCTWTPLAGFTNRWGHTTISIGGGRFVVLGGWTGSQVAQTQVYDALAGTWSNLGQTLSTPRFFHSSYWYRNRKASVASGPKSGECGDNCSGIRYRSRLSRTG